MCYGVALLGGEIGPAEVVGDGLSCDDDEHMFAVVGTVDTYNEHPRSELMGVVPEFKVGKWHRIPSRRLTARIAC
jgi:hypothetical protein